jgi:CubicO group peptidase (beta-lactamase class C family)
MQLVEQGKLALDDSVQLELLAPELKRVRVLERDENNGFRLNRKERSITLRMLLNHTCKKTPNPSCHFTLTLKFHVRPIIAGFGYAFEDIKLRDWSRPVGIDDFSGNPNDVLHGPLVSQPGTKFQYGVGLDWVGTLVERVTGLSLEEYFQTFILRPLDIKSITFFPCKESKATVAYMHSRTADGTLSIRDHLYRYPLLPYNPQEYHFCMGGAGCFGKPVEYCRASMLHALRVGLIC